MQQTSKQFPQSEHGFDFISFIHTFRDFAFGLSSSHRPSAAYLLARYSRTPALSLSLLLSAQCFSLHRFEQNLLDLTRATAAKTTPHLTQDLSPGDPSPSLIPLDSIHGKQTINAGDVARTYFDIRIQLAFR